MRTATPSPASSSRSRHPARASLGDVLSATTGTTDATGSTSVTATANGTVGIYVVTATLPNGTEVNFTLTNAGVPPNTITVSSGAPASAVVGTAFTAPLVALVKDGTGTPIANALVTFSDPAVGATAQLSAPTALTNASGLAQITATASTQTGSYSVVATAVGAASPAVFNLTNTPGAPASIVASPSSSPQSAQVGMAFASPLVVTVLDAYGNPIPGVTVAYTPPASGASATLGTIVATDANGQVSVPATANGTAGTYTITATVTGLANGATFTLTNTTGAPSMISVKSGSPQSTTVGTAFAAPLVAQVLDSSSNPVAGATVTFSPPVTGASAVLGSATAVTDANGLATTTATANDTSGSYSVVATLPGAGAPAIFSLTNNAGAPATITASASSTPQTAQVNTAYGQPLIITVADAFGNGVPGITVTYAPPATGASVSLAATTPTTSSSGQTSVVAIANATAGAFSVIATVTGLTPTATFALTNTASAPSAINVTSGGGQSTEATTAFTNPIVLNVQDALGNPVPGAPITVTVPTTGASATFTPTSPTTDLTGTATINFTANAHVGAYTVSFSLSGAASPSSVTMTNTAIPTTTTLTVSTTTPVEGANITLTAVVGSTTGTPGGSVTFFAGTTQLGTATITGGSAVLVVAAPAAGNYSITAEYPATDPFGTSTSNAITLNVSSLAGDGGVDGGTDGGDGGGVVDGGPHPVDGGNDATTGASDAGEDSSSPPGEDGSTTDSGAGTPDSGPGTPGTDATVPPSNGADSGPPGTPSNPSSPSGSIQGGGCTCTNAVGTSSTPAGTSVLVGLAFAALLGRSSRSRKRRAARD